MTTTQAYYLLVTTPLPDFFVSSTSIDPTVLTFFDGAAYAKDEGKCRLITEYALMMAGRAVVYRSKSKTQAAMTAPTTICKDNEACIKITNSDHPTDWTRQVDTPFSVSWTGVNTETSNLKHITGITNPVDSHSTRTVHRLEGSFTFL